MKTRLHKSTSISQQAQQTLARNDRPIQYSRKITPILGRGWRSRSAGLLQKAALIAISALASIPVARAQTYGFDLGINDNGGLTVLNTSSPGYDITSVRIALTNDTFFDTTNTAPGTSSTGWVVYTNPSAASVTLPSNASTDGQQHALLGMGHLATNQYVDLGFDLDTYTSPDSNGNPLGAKIFTTFSNGRQLASSIAYVGVSPGYYSYSTSASAPVAGPSILKVDFNVGASSPNEPGWQSFAVNNGSASQSNTYATITTYTSGNTTITVAGSNNLSTRDRAVPAADTADLSLSEVYRDFVVADTLTLTLGGLKANTEYVLTFYAYDNAGASPMTYTNTTGGVQPSSTATLETTASVSYDGQHTQTLNAVANSTGQVQFTVSAANGARINGLEVNAVPEPSTYVLLVVGALGLFFARQRRKMAKTVGCGTFGLLLLGICQASAAFIVTPTGAAGTEGDEDNGWPFNVTGSGLSNIRYQQVYNSSLFSSLPAGGGSITQIIFRPDVSAAAFSSTLSQIRIDLSTTTANENTLSTNFSTNIGANNVTVYGGATGGSLSLSSSASGPIGGPKTFDIVITLATPFFYNPAGGNLLLDVRNFSGGATTQFDAAIVSGDGVARIYSDVSSSTGSKDTLGLVTTFNVVPEPQTWLLISLGAIFFSKALLRFGLKAVKQKI